MSAKIVMYESVLCGYCRAAKRLLKNKGWEYEVIVVDAQPAKRREMQERSGRTSVPQIWFDDTHVGGFDDMAELDADGKLDALYNPS